MHRYHRVPVGYGGYGFGRYGGFGQVDPSGINAAIKSICEAGGGVYNAANNSCDVDVPQPPGTGVPPGTVAGYSMCDAQTPCPPGTTCTPPPPAVAWALPPGASICIPSATTPTTPGQPPSMPPTQPPAQPPPGMPPETKKSILGLPPTAVYIGLGAIGLLALAAVMKKRR